jgi:pyruvate kinase
VRHTKIVATLGPATSSEAAIRDLVAAGVDVFRLNFSHGTHETHGHVIAHVRNAAAAMGHHVAILQDLSGPKIRTGELKDHAPIALVPGDELQIVVGNFAGERGRIATTYADLPKAVRPGATLLLDDGRIQLRVEKANPNELHTVVVDGGVLGEHKGINAPGAPLPSAGLTAKDAEDLRFGVQMGIDFVALSFVQSAADLRQARDALARAGAPQTPLVAKLERPEAVQRLEEIIAECDAVMVARGDLGLEMPLERVPRIQKEITRRARAAGIPVIVATQVLESMRIEPRPTRAEVSDAANAVDDSVDAIMLAGETAVGEHPVRAVQTLDAIIRDAETIPPVGTIQLDQTHLLTGHGRAICEAAVTMAERGDANAIVAVTRGGKTARLLSALRPRVPIYGVTDQALIAGRLSLAWGVEPMIADLTGEMVATAAQIGKNLRDRGAIPPAGVVVLVSINPDLTRRDANFLKLQRLG